MGEIAAMGATRDDFVKYPRTPHLFGSTGTENDRRLGPAESAAFIAAPSLLVEEKLDGTNVGIHFTTCGRMVLQCRGHEITEGMHPQYDLFKQWTMVKRPVLEAMLADRFILFGEWLYARHSVYYRKLPHYFFEFDLYDKEAGHFLDLEARTAKLSGSGIHTVPVVHRPPHAASVLSLKHCGLGPDDCAQASGWTTGPTEAGAISRLQNRRRPAGNTLRRRTRRIRSRPLDHLI
jgi:hypothetical protein